MGAAQHEGVPSGSACQQGQQGCRHRRHAPRLPGEWAQATPRRCRPRPAAHVCGGGAACGCWYAAEPRHAACRTTRVTAGVGAAIPPTPAVLPPHLCPLAAQTGHTAGPSNPLPSPPAQVDGCTQAVGGGKDYHSRYKICEYHLKAHVVQKDGRAHRFCQQARRPPMLLRAAACCMLRRRRRRRRRARLTLRPLQTPPGRSVASSSRWRTLTERSGECRTEQGMPECVERVCSQCLLSGVPGRRARSRTARKA